MANRLAQETSPYLLQHKDNPVDWYPWGEEALARAASEDKPLLISIGYAACHWCHVMERESFEDPAIAKQMNESFIPIKVDREERPDIDAVYMAATQALTGGGGWPMTVFATPEGVPFLAGTYFPAADRGGMPGFPRVLEQVNTLWTTRRDDLLGQGRQILQAIERSAPASSNEPLQANLLLKGTSEILSAHDSRHGGFGRAPKFPQAPVLELLLRMSGKVPGTSEALQRTLRAMALGGIYDQLGGGFARYATDETWTVPHFEKMLYDNAQLARVYTHAWQAYDDPLYLRIATETLDYLLYDMRDEAGGFHSSEDADSEGEEGTFYVWTREELAEIAPDAAAYYGLDGEPNFEGRYVLTAASPEPPQQARERLLVTRGRRVRPGRDDKVLTSWNGLAISALAEAGSAFGRPDFVEAAAEAATFLLDTMTEGDRLLHTYRAGKAHVSGFCEDYAYLTEGLLALWEATFDRRWLEAAHRLAQQALDLFADSSGGFFTTASDQQALVVRQKEIIESATPAPGGVLAQVLQKLAVLFDQRDLERGAVDALRVTRVYMERAAQAVPTWMCALDFYLSTPTEVAFTGDLGSDDGKRLLEAVNTRFLPNRVLAAGSADGIALLRDKPEGDRPLAYVCERYVCKKPTSDPDELTGLLRR